MIETAQWEGKVGESWAREWRRTDRSFGGLTDRLLGAASAGSVFRALDIGCGAGELSLALARGHPSADITGIDVSAELIAVAQERGGKLHNVSFEQADAANWQSGEKPPGLLVSRHGVMFFDDPVAAFTSLREQAAQEARLVFSCFRSIEENVWADRVAGFLPSDVSEPVDPRKPGPFAFADPNRIVDILSKAGWSEIAFEPFDYAYIAGVGSDPVADAQEFFLAIGPAARGAAALDDSRKAKFIAKLRRFLANHRDGNMVAMRAAAWIVTARSETR